MATEPPAPARLATPRRRGRWLWTAGLAGGICAALAAGPAPARGPLSAIDWLSESVVTPRGAQVAPPLTPARPREAGRPGGVIPSSVPLPQRGLDEPAVTRNATPSLITSSVLGKPSPDGVGLLAPARTGLPGNLWGLARTEDIARLLTAERIGTLPALQSLLMTILLAEAEPPVDSGGRGVLLLARVDKLLAMGALDQAMALTSMAGTPTPELFRRRFDISLLTGDEDAACAEMQAAPHLAPTLPARIFCLARAGDWQAAALSLGTARALGQVSAEDEALLSRFLDPELADGAPPLPPPATPTPLVWRMYEAIGEPLPTLGLPIAFSHADLRAQSGWKAQIEAAERLARIGAIAPNMLLGLYTERRPAASGGVWDRAAAFQRLDRAVAANDGAATSKVLADTWAAMASAELEIPFAQLYGAQLVKMDLSPEAGELAFRIALLSPDYEAAARAHAARRETTPTEASAGDIHTADETWLIGLATGQLQGVTAPDSMARAIAPAFLAPDPGAQAQVLLDERRSGEALLQAMDDIGRGVTGDPRSVARGLSVLRALGLEEDARRTALELLLLERRG